MRLSLRWMIRRDLDEVVRIEHANYGPDAWTEADFVRTLQHRNFIGTICQAETDVVGFAIYRLGTCMWLPALVVDPELHRMGIGSTMVAHLQNKASVRQRVLKVLVAELNTPGQLFLKHAGFDCIEILHDCYDDCDQPGYLFCWPAVPTVHQIAELSDERVEVEK